MTGYESKRAAAQDKLAQPAQELDDFLKSIAAKNPKPFPQRTWVDLTDDEIEDLFQSAAGADEETHIRFARAIENALRSKNI